MCLCLCVGLSVCLCVEGPECVFVCRGAIVVSNLPECVCVCVIFLDIVIL